MNYKIKRFARVRGLVWKVISSGLPTDHDLEVLRKIVLENLLLLVGFISLPILCTILFKEKHYLLCAVDTVFFLFLVVMFFYLRKTKKHDSAAIISMVAMAGLFFFFIVYGGVSNKTYYTWSFLYPFLTMFLLGTVRGTFFAFLLLGLVFIVFFIGRYQEFISLHAVENEIRFATAYITMYLISFVIEKVRQSTQVRLNVTNARLKKTLADKEDLIRKLQKTIDEVTALRGILPICSQCKKIRDDKGYWHQVETYLRTHSEADFTHSLCPDCIEKLYPDLEKRDKIPQVNESLATAKTGPDAKFL